MKVEKNLNKNLNYQKIAIIAVAIIILVVLVIFFITRFSKNNELKLDDFEKISIYKYLEDDFLDVSELYQLSGKTNYNELQIFQSKLKQALDLYFSNHSETEVSTSTILGLIDSKYVPDSVDFHGIIVSDYKYNVENDSFEKSTGTNSNIAVIESEINSIDYSDKKASVQKIEKTSDDNYKVYFNIVNSTVSSDVSETSGEAIISVENNDLKIVSCDLND